MDTAAWLRSLGPERHEPGFRENEIHDNVLCGLTAGHLIALGITSVGCRRKLFDAITAMGAGKIAPGEARVAR